MEFAVQALEGRAAEVMQLRALAESGELARRGASTAWAWFLEGTQLDAAGEDDRALIAYGKALDGDPQLAAAHTNLGALLYRREARAMRRAADFEEALRLDPEQPEARYNFANLLDELGEADRAIAEWFRVVGNCPEFADAHFNLAQALARDGAREPARRHLERYLALDGSGEWAERARELLTELLPTKSCGFENRITARSTHSA